MKTRELSEPEWFHHPIDTTEALDYVFFRLDDGGDFVVYWFKDEASLGDPPPRSDMVTPEAAAYFDDEIYRYELWDSAGNQVGEEPGLWRENSMASILALAAEALR